MTRRQPAVDSPLATVLRVLDLDQVTPTHFRGRQPDDDRARVFGGQIAAQALMAAGRTAGGRAPISVHAYFVRPGDVRIPVEYEVDTVRDGRTVAVRRIRATQHGVSILEAMASFDGVRTSEGDRNGGDDGWTAPEYHREMPMVAAPESLSRIEVQLSPYADEFDGWWVRPRAFDMRYVTPPPRVALDLPANHSRVNRLWLRADGRVPADPLLNACLVTYVSDLTLLDPVMIAARRTSRGPGFTASLDHSLWFHRPAVLEDWILYDQFSASATNGRGLVSAAMFNRSGDLVCLVSQEGYLAGAR